MLINLTALTTVDTNTNVSYQRDQQQYSTCLQYSGVENVYITKQERMKSGSLHECRYTAPSPSKTKMIPNVTIFIYFQIWPYLTIQLPLIMSHGFLPVLIFNRR